MNPAHAVNQEACCFDGVATGWNQSFIRTGGQGFAGENPGKQQPVEEMHQATGHLRGPCEPMGIWLCQ